MDLTPQKVSVKVFVQKDKFILVEAALQSVNYAQLGATLLHFAQVAFLYTNFMRDSVLMSGLLLNA